MSIRRRVGGINQVGADDALPPQHLGRHLAVAAGRWSPHLLRPTSPGLSKFWTSWGQVIRAQVPTTNGSSQRVGALALSDPKYSFERGGAAALELSDPKYNISFWRRLVPNDGWTDGAHVGRLCLHGHLHFTWKKVPCCCNVVQCNETKSNEVQRNAM